MKKLSYSDDIKKNQITVSKFQVKDIGRPPVLIIIFFVKSILYAKIMLSQKF